MNRERNMTRAMIRMAATKKEIFVVSSVMMSPHEYNAVNVAILIPNQAAIFFDYNKLIFRHFFKN